MVDRKAFVISSFQPQYKELYERTIKPRLMLSGYGSNRIESQPEQSNVPNQIARSIIEADLVVADISEPSPNVFYELGISHAVGNKTIVIARKDAELSPHHNDESVIRYSPDNPRKLEEDLKRRIEELGRVIEFTPDNPVQRADALRFDVNKRISTLLKELNGQTCKIKKKMREKRFLHGTFQSVDHTTVVDWIHDRVVQRQEESGKEKVAVSICGFGASGKSTLAKSLREKIGKDEASILPTDAYMEDRAARVKTGLMGFDPKANRLDDLRADVEKLLGGSQISISPYCHETGEHAEPVDIRPANILILEGIYSFHPELSQDSCSQLKYFLYAGKDKAKELKFISDIQERGHSIMRALAHAAAEYSAYEEHIIPQIKKMKMEDQMIEVTGFWTYSFGADHAGGGARV